MNFEFNSDLLLDEKDREAALMRFPNIYFALDNEELRRAFVKFDERANTAKRNSRRWGTLAVALGLIALGTAAAEPLYGAMDESTQHIFEAGAAGAGVLSVVIGLFGVMFRSRKALWLQDRLSTEKLRQFQFQSIITQLPEILRGSKDPDAKQIFLRNRQAKLAGFTRDFLALADAEMPDGNGDHDAAAAWIWEMSKEPLDPKHPNVDQLLAAYEALRIQRQLQYANFKLSGYRRIWRHAPTKQANIFSAVALGCVLLILLIHALVLYGAGFEVPWMTDPLVHVVAIWTAMAALAARTLEEGLQPAREVERLRHYHSTLKLIYRRFKASTSLPDKLLAMSQIEEAAHEEMLMFLKASAEAKFVM